ncbi:hypothetical protein ACPPVU_11830 [Mucilaginibacter sp. McL0603]|uniref:hypothetical protein n=1 Tax=Mucilaginibacter sp. McL0603 TaxID=3415670 RepID=UPI003CEC1E68
MPTTTEHLVNYGYKGAERTMLVKVMTTEYEKVFIIRTRRGEVALQYYDYRWNVISPVKMDYTLSQIVGEAISKAGL